MSQLNLNRPDELQRDCVDDFFEDFRDAYEQCETTLIELEQNPQQSELLHGIFRVVHTIKGNLGFIGLFSLIPAGRSQWCPPSDARTARQRLRRPAPAQSADPPVV